VKNLANGPASAFSNSNTLLICESFVSVCGETTRQGLPAWFVRLSRCNLRCDWCDTEYSWDSGRERAVGELLAEARDAGRDLAVVTGGEPLLQANAPALIAGLADLGMTVLVETNGTLPIDGLDPRAVRIVDVKPPSAKVAEPFLAANLSRLRPTDEVKFPVADRADFDSAVEFVRAHRLEHRCPLLISPVADRVNASDVADWVLASPVRFRLQLQLHKMLWGANARGR